MHKRNIAIGAAILSAIIAAIIAGAFIVYPALSHITFLRWLYKPAILLSLLFSRSIHSISAFNVWANFVFLTLFYWVIIWVILLVLYALDSELRIIHNAFYHVDLDYASQSVKAAMSVVPQSLPGQPTFPDEAVLRMYLESIGLALRDVEMQRRKHPFLQDMNFLHLDDDDWLLGAHAITMAADQRPIQHLLKRLKSNLEKELGRKKAAVLLANLIAYAHKVAP